MKHTVPLQDLALRWRNVEQSYSILANKHCAWGKDVPVQVTWEWAVAWAGRCSQPAVWDWQPLYFLPGPGIHQSPSRFTTLLHLFPSLPFAFLSPSTHRPMYALSGPTRVAEGEGQEGRSALREKGGRRGWRWGKRAGRAFGAEGEGRAGGSALREKGWRGVSGGRSEAGACRRLRGSGARGEEVLHGPGGSGHLRRRSPAAPGVRGKGPRGKGGERLLDPTAPPGCGDQEGVVAQWRPTGQVRLSGRVAVECAIKRSGQGPACTLGPALLTRFSEIPPENRKHAHTIWFTGTDIFVIEVLKNPYRLGSHLCRRPWEGLFTAWFH